jgi:hypothetical protein
MKFIFKIIYWKWFNDCEIIKIKGIRTAIVERRGKRSTETPIFRIGRYEY